MVTSQNQVEIPRRSIFSERLETPRRLRKPTFTFHDLDGKREGWMLRKASGFFLGWEKRRPNGTLKPMWYARFSRNLVPEYCLTSETIKSLPDKPLGERVVE